MILNNEIQNVGKKRDSVASCNEAENALGYNINRAEIPEHKRMKRHKSKMKTMSPKIVRPLNLCGVFASNRAIPPVLIVRVNHAHVK